MGWQTKPIGEVILKTPTFDPRKDPNKQFQYVDVSGVSNETLEITDIAELLGKDAPSRARRVIAEGNVIFATVRPTLRRIAVVPSHLDGEVCSTGYFVFNPKEEIFNRYLYYFLQSEFFMGEMESVQAGASYPAVNDSQVKATSISYPPIPEQKRIVAILDQAFADIDRARALTEQNLKNARELFDSKRFYLFESLAASSKVMSLPELCEEIYAGGDAPKKGMFSKEKTEEFKYPIYANAVKKSGLYGFSEKVRTQKPSITIAARGSGTGHIELRDEPFLPIVRLIVLTPDTQAVLLGYLKLGLQTLDILRSGSAIPQLTVPMIKGYSIPVPNLEKQREIVEELDEVKKSSVELCSLYMSKLQLLEELKKSLLQKAFSGQLTAKDAA